MTLPSPRPGILPADPLALRRIVDEIVYQAGKASPGEAQKGMLRIEWNPATGEIAFVDTGEGAHLFAAFRDGSGLPLEPLKVLSRQVAKLGVGAHLDLSVDRDDGHIIAIRIVFPDAESQRIASISDQKALATAWDAFAPALIGGLQESRAAMAALAEAQGRGQPPSREEIDRALIPLRNAYRTALAFERQPTAPSSADAWGNIFVMTQIRWLRNVMSPIGMILSMSGMTRRAPDASRIHRSLSNATGLMHHLMNAYANDPQVRGRLAVELDDPQRLILPANPQAAHRIVDLILYEAGRASPGGDHNPRIRIEWDPQRGELAFLDQGNEVPAFNTFSFERSTPRHLLASLVPQLGEGADLRLTSDPATGRVTKIVVVVPVEGTADPSPQGHGQSGGGSPVAGGSSAPHTPPAPTTPPSASLKGFGGITFVSGGEPPAAPFSPADGPIDPLAVPGIDTAVIGGMSDTSVVIAVPAAPPLPAP